VSHRRDWRRPEGAIADASDRYLLRLENFDVDIPPDAEAIAVTRNAVADDAATATCRSSGTIVCERRWPTRLAYLRCRVFSERNRIISAGESSGTLNALLATIEVGSEVIVTDPTYVGLLNRIRLVGGAPTFVPFMFTPGGEWRLDNKALRAAVGPNTRAMLLMSLSMPSGGSSMRTIGHSSRH
jgi:aspartate/methionine/tyrosine aminotransferase